MCSVCHRIDGMAPAAALEVIAQAFAEGGIDRKHMDAVIDGLLGTGLDESPEDPELAAEYERRNKGESDG
jgi:NAD(P)H-hydrate repair Nnr-like enzyme with NAD(P)H-hydrate epimerase domain